MKNLLKFGFLGLILSLSVVACNSNKATDSTTDSIDSTTDVTTDAIDSTADAKVDTIDSVSDAKIDSIQKK